MQTKLKNKIIENEKLFRNNNRFIEITNCPYCDSKDRRFFGLQPTGIARYTCKQCKTTYQQFRTKDYKQRTRARIHMEMKCTKTEEKILKLYLQGKDTSEYISPFKLQKLIKLYIDNINCKIKRAVSSPIQLITFQEATQYYKNNPLSFALLITPTDVKLIHTPTATVTIPIDQIQEFIQKGYKVISSDIDDSLLDDKSNPLYPLNKGLDLENNEYRLVNIKETENFITKGWDYIPIDNLSPKINKNPIKDPTKWAEILSKHLDTSPNAKKHKSSITNILMKIRPDVDPHRMELRACAIALQLHLKIKKDHQRQYAVAFKN